MIILRQKQESLIGPGSLFYRPKYNPGPGQKLSPEKEEEINRKLLELIGDDEELRKLYNEMKKNKKHDNKDKKSDFKR